MTRMKKTIFFGTLLFATLFVGCKDNNDDVEEVNNIATPNETNFQNLRKAALEELTVKKEFTVDGSGAIEYTSDKGVKIIIPEDCLLLNGNTVSGTVQLEFVELFDKAPLLTTNIATMGWDPIDNTAKFLVTGGAFFVKLTQNGQEIENSAYCSYNLEVPANLTGGANPDMKLWYGNFNDDGNLIWNEVETRPIGEEFPGSMMMSDGLFVSNDTYYVITNKFGWVNVDVFYDNDNREQTSFTVKAPNEYNNTNSAVYLAYKNVEGLAIAYYDKNKKVFTTGGYTLPIGLEISAIFASESNGKWVYAIKNITITKDIQVEFLKSELKEATQAELEAEISKL